MTDVNHVELTGRLIRNAELARATDGQTVCKFSILVKPRKERGIGLEEVNFFDIVFLGEQGEALSRYLVKGVRVSVYGELRQDRWEANGRNHTKVEIIAGMVQMPDSSTNEKANDN
jgi:single-strand DNA-binding protein